MEKKLNYTLGLVFACVMLIPTQAGAAKCEELTKLNLRDVAITSSTSVPAGRFTPPGSSNSLETREFCRVVAVAKPTPDSVINFEVWIPSAAEWNRDFEGVGNGGYTGAIQYVELADALKRGFAAASTDTGHTGADLAFAAGHSEKVVDWGYRAIHIMDRIGQVDNPRLLGCSPKTLVFYGLLDRGPPSSF